MTTKTKAPMREGVSKAKAPVRKGLASLNEFLDSNNLAGSISSALERSEVVIAAEAIVQKLQKMAEDLSSVEAKDIMPLLDSLTNSFGAEVAQNFNNVATEQVRTLITSVQGAKSALDNEIIRLKKGVESGEVSDMAMDTGATPMMPSAAPAAPSGEPGMGEPGAEMGEPALPDAPPDMAGNAEDDALAAGAGFAGREKKEAVESRKVRGKKVAEDVMPQVPHSHESHNLEPNLSNLHIFHGGLGRQADAIRNMIRTEELSGDQRKALAGVLSNMSAFASEPAHWQGVDADQKLQMALQTAGIWKVETPGVQKIVQALKRMAHVLAAKHDGMLEANIAMLKKASNPDAIVLNMFRTKLKENRDSQLAAIHTARAFAIDIEDVVAVVKEAAARRPFPPKLTKFKKRGWKGGKDGSPVEEDSPPLMQGVPMFPVEQTGAASTITKNPLDAPTNAQPQPPSTMTPATGEIPGNSAPSTMGAATNKPLTPADKRAQQNAQQQQMAASNQQQQQQSSPQPPKAQDTTAKQYEPPEEVQKPSSPKQRGFMQQQR